MVPTGVSAFGYGMKFRPLIITGSGLAVPARAVSAAEIDVRAGLRAGWTSRHAGVERRFFAEGETASQLGATAARQALAEAGHSLADVDAIICVGGTMQQPIPCNAALLAAELGRETDGLMTFDVNSTCLGFLTGLDVVSAQLMAGSYQRALVVAAEVGSTGLDWSQPESAAIIGDGAAAVIVESPSAECLAGGNQSAMLGAIPANKFLSPAPPLLPGILGTAFQTWSEGASLTAIQGGGTARPARLFTPDQKKDYLFQMDGPGVFRLASRHLPGFVRTFMERYGWTWQDFALIIPHQGSPASVALLRRRLGIPPELLFCYASDYGNTIAASIPMGLHLARAAGRVGPGDHVLMLGTSAGFSMGAVVLRL